MTGKVLFFAAILAVCAAVITGLVLTGGPLQSRRDRFDAQRYAALDRLVDGLLCNYNSKSRSSSLPAELTVESLRAQCASAGVSADDLSDSETGAPYVYVRKNAQDFLICATFHDARRTVRLESRPWSAASFDPGTGCVSGSLR
jgi:hypothetical protein